ncbi:MFS transporter [Phenylobacterium sp.]|uniref:MFS transporter n=1 Tax=Phenylobacterium sp. TaxID=1871053 RepID=UPI00121FFA44|nr:MFS transporter [Phenylobacterium sp.]THD68681.1 MAG: MFS transporter [Phenylobacterium sp.]
MTSASTTARASADSAALILGLCFLTAVCEGFDVQAAGVTGAGVAHAFHVAPSALGWFFSASNIGLLLGAGVGGRLSDRLGRRSVLIASLFVFGGFSLATATAQDLNALTLFRLLTGLGLGGALPNALAIAADYGGLSPRSGHIAIGYFGMPLGGAVASALTVVLPADHWREVFVLGGVSPLVTAAGVWLLMPSATGRSGLAHGMEARRPGGVVDALFGGGRAARSVALWLGFLLMALALHLMLNWLPLLLQAQGLSKSQAGLAQVGFNLGGAAAAIATGVMMDTAWRRAAVAAAVVALPVLLLGVAALHGPAIMGLAIVLGGAVLAVQVILYAVAGALYPTAVRGTGLGIGVAFSRVGSIAGPAFAAVLLASGGSAAQVLTGLLPIAIVGGVCVLALAWRRPPEGLG